MARIKATTSMLVAATTLAGCVHRGSLPPTLSPSAANFPYHAPSTTLKLAGDLVLLRCDAGAGGIVVSSSLALSASADADRAASFQLEGSSLMSALQRRELAVDLFDNGTLKSVNAAASDRTGTVITNLLKTVASVAGAFVGAGPLLETQATRPRTPPPRPCNAETLEALQRVNEYRSELQRLRVALANATPEQTESIGHRMELIAQQIGLLTTTRLTITVSKPVDLGEGPTAAGENRSIRLSFSDLRQWFGNPNQPGGCTPNPGAVHLFSGSGTDLCAYTTNLMAMTYTISADDVAAPENRVARSPCLASAPTRPVECGRTIVMPRPAYATILVRNAADNGAGMPERILARAVTPVPQWGQATYLPVNVRAFQSRSIGFAYNPFGERRSFKWNSEATAENATAALVSVTEAGAGIVSTVRGPTDTERLTAENEELEARMANNRLRICEQAILAGATSCDPPEEDD